MKTIKYSRQREAILNFLKDRKDHPTADIIYNSLREEYPNISLGTVYRNLTFLSASGQILKLTCGDSSDHFDFTSASHPHFVCTDCKKVLDLPLDDLSFLNTLVEKSSGGKVYYNNLLFYGLCSECIDKN